MSYQLPRKYINNLINIGLVIFCCARTTSAQQEEGFRWRSNFDELSIDGMSIFGIQQDHIQMYALESFISHHLPETHLGRNVAVAGISLVYSSAERFFDRVFIPVYNITEDEGETGDISIFVSGTAFSNRLYTPRQSLNTWLESNPISWLPTQTHERSMINEISGLNVETGILYKNLSALFSQTLTEQDHISPSSCAERQNELSGAQDKSMNYHHSEQWLLHYLGLRKDKKTNFMLLVDMLAKKRTNPGKIRVVILHIHSKNDLCKRCTQTINRVIQERNGFIQNLSEYVRETYNNNEELPLFLVLASSRINYSEQNRREKYGHDNSISVPISIQSFVPYFAQTVLPDPPIRQSFIAPLTSPHS